MPTFNGTAGADVIDRSADTVANQLNGLDGNDTLAGGAGVDSLFGGAGNDRLIGNAGADFLIGGTGDDIYVVNDSSDTIIENVGEGTDTIQSSTSFSLSSRNNIENLTLTGGAQGIGNALNNVITGNTLNNALRGGDGHDVLRGMAGDDILSGENGNDTVEGGDGADSLNGGLDNDSLVGEAGADTLVGGAGIDILRGGLDNDVYVVNDQLDTITELANEGIDTVQSSVDFDMTGLANVENLTIHGTASVTATGNDLSNVITVTSSAGTNFVHGGLGHDTIVGSIGKDLMSGEAGDDSMQGGAGNDFLNGGEGSDILIGGDGVDTLWGGEGNDRYIISDAFDNISEQAGEGNDQVEASVSFSLANFAQVEDLTLTGTANIDATGNALDNFLLGNSGSNFIEAGAGNDTIGAGSGDDLVAGGDGVDSIFGGSGDDLLSGGQGDDVLNGQTGVDQLDGGAGNDRLLGGTSGDFYIADGAFGQDTISDTDTTVGAKDELHFLSTNFDSLWFKQSGTDLEISVVGTTDKMTVQNWFGGANSQVEVIYDGQHQLNSQNVQGLVNAMAGFTTPQNLSTNATLTAARDQAWITL